MAQEILIFARQPDQEKERISRLRFERLEDCHYQHGAFAGRAAVYGITLASGEAGDIDADSSVGEAVVMNSGTSSYFTRLHISQRHAYHERDMKRGALLIAINDAKEQGYAFRTDPAGEYPDIGELWEEFVSEGTAKVIHEPEDRPQLAHTERIGFYKKHVQAL